LEAQSPAALATSAIQIGEACVAFSGDLDAQGFFIGLKRIKTNNGPVFRKGPRVFSDYPDKTILEAEPSVVRCSKTMKYAGDWAIEPQDFLGSLRAEAWYIRDLHRYSLDISLSEEGYGPWYPANEVHWHYQYVITTKGVHLTDKLMVSLYMKDGTKVGEFIVDLGGKTGLW
jgi:hypothetical protein